MSKKYEAPIAEKVPLLLELNFCLSGDGTEDVGKKTELDDDDFE